MLPIASKPINLTEGKKTTEKSVHKHQIPRVLKQYLILLVIVTIIAAIVFGVFMFIEQKRFFRVEASSILCYHPEQHTDLIPRLSIHEVLQIIRNDAVKLQAGDVVSIAQDKQKYLKEAIDISCDSASGSHNMLKISVKWNDAEQARQLLEGYNQTAITAYVHFQTKYLLEVIAEKDKTKSEFEHKKAAIEEKMSKLVQSVHAESVKQALETLRMQEIHLQNELSEFQKQHSLMANRRDNLKNSIPSQYDYAKLKTALLHPYILDFIQKRDDALDNYEIQKAAGAENEHQVKEAQLKYRFAEDRLNKALENLNLKEDEVRSLNTVIFKHVEDLESVQTTLNGLDKCIEDIQDRLSQKQKEISAASELLPQEEELSRIHMATLASLNQIENEIMERDRLAMSIKKALIPLNFISVRHVNSFSFKNYISYLLIGIAIIFLSASVFILTNTHGKRHAPTTSPNNKQPTSNNKPTISSNIPPSTSSTIKPPAPSAVNS